MYASRNLKYYSETEGLDSRCRPWPVYLKMKKSCGLYWQAKKKKPRKENEKQLINDFGRDTSVSTALLTMKLLWSCMVDTLLNTFLFARCIFASINFELATTIAFCLVCLLVTTSNENEHTRSTWNPFSFRRDLYLIQVYSSLTNLTLLSMDLT